MKVDLTHYAARWIDVRIKPTGTPLRGVQAADDVTGEVVFIVKDDVDFKGYREIVCPGMDIGFYLQPDAPLSIAVLWALDGGQ